MSAAQSRGYFPGAEVTGQLVSNNGEGARRGGGKKIESPTYVAGSAWYKGLMKSQGDDWGVYGEKNVNRTFFADTMNSFSPGRFPLVARAASFLLRLLRVTGHDASHFEILYVSMRPVTWFHYFFPDTATTVAENVFFPTLPSDFFCPFFRAPFFAKHIFA